MKDLKEKILLTIFIVGISSFYYSQNSEKLITEKPTVLIIPAFDLHTNGGFSPEIQYLLESKFSENLEIRLIKFPLKKLMNIPYQNVYDKKYCTVILEKVKTDFIIMSKIELENIIASPKKWNLNFRILETKNGKQIDSKLLGKNLTKLEIEEKLKKDYKILIEEIKKL